MLVIPIPELPDPSVYRVPTTDRYGRAFYDDYDMEMQPGPGILYPLCAMPLNQQQLYAPTLHDGVGLAFNNNMAPPGAMVWRREMASPAPDNMFADNNINQQFCNGGMPVYYQESRNPYSPPSSPLHNPYRSGQDRNEVMFEIDPTSRMRYNCNSPPGFAVATGCICDPSPAFPLRMEYNGDPPPVFEDNNFAVGLEPLPNVAYPGNAYVLVPTIVPTYNVVPKKPLLIAVAIYSVEDGVVLHQRETLDPFDEEHYVLLRVEDGHVVMDWNLGAGGYSLEADDIYVNDGDRHEIVAKFLNKNSAWLSVDGNIRTGGTPAYYPMNYEGMNAAYDPNIDPNADITEEENILNNLQNMFHA